MNISLSQENKNLVQSFLDSGNYGNAMEVIQEALALLKAQRTARDEKEELFRLEVMKGVESIRTHGYSKRTAEEIADDVLESYLNQ